MDGIYITQEQKEELEAKITHFRNLLNNSEDDDNELYYTGIVHGLEFIIDSGIVLPVEESWDNIFNKQLQNVVNNIKEPVLETKYPNGVIIKQK